jgi:urease accessory protein
MYAIKDLLQQRSRGEITFRMGRDGVKVLREAGCSKLRLPPGSTEAILINTSGGLAGGDTIQIDAAVEDNGHLTLTSQAAERVYRTIGKAADVSISLSAGANSHLLWLPQETIFYQDSALSRRIDVQLADNARFVAVEPMIFGRTEMGEAISSVSISDNWRIWQDGKLIHAETMKLGPTLPTSPAELSDNRAVATLLLVTHDAARLGDTLRHIVGATGGVSAWNGKLIARILARDGYALRKTLIQALCVCVGPQGLPKTWTF